MKSILVFAAAEESTRRALAPFKLPGFLTKLSEEDVEPVVVDVDGHERGSPAAILRSDTPRLVHTFGDVGLLSATWRDAAQAGCLLVHSVLGNRAPDSNFRSYLPKFLRSRRASRYVQTVLGSSRAQLRDYIEAGFFSRAKF